MPKRYKDLYSILKHPKIKLKIGEKVVQTIRIKKIFIVYFLYFFRLPGGPSKKRNVMTPSLDMRYPEQHFNEQHLLN